MCIRTCETCRHGPKAPYEPPCRDCYTRPGAQGWTSAPVLRARRSKPTISELRTAVLEAPRDSSGRVRNCPFCGKEVDQYRREGGAPRQTCDSTRCIALRRRLTRRFESEELDQVMMTPQEALAALVRAIREGVDGVELHWIAEKAARTIE